MKNKSLNKLMQRIVWNNKGKLFVISLVLSIAITIFTAFGFSNTFLQKNVDTLKTKYKSYDFIFNRDATFTEDKINKLAKKYKFTFENKNVKEVEQTIKVPGKKPIVHFDNQNSFGVKYLVSPDQRKAQIVTPFTIKGRWLKNDNEAVVLPQLLNVTNKHIGDNIEIGGKNLKIVGTYSTPQYQRNVQTSLTDKSTYIIPVQVTNKTYNDLSGTNINYIYGHFDKISTYKDRLNLYEKMKNEKDFINIEKFPKYKLITKTLKYNKNKVCGGNSLIEQYSNNPELEMSQFNRIATLILQAQSGGECRTTLGDKSLDSAQSKGANYINSLSQASSASDNINNNAGDLTPHYKTPKIITYTPKSYSYPKNLVDYAQKLANEVNNTTQAINKENTVLFVLKTNKSYANFKYISRGFEDINSASKILDLASKGQTSLDYKFKISYSDVSVSPQRNFVFDEKDLKSFQWAGATHNWDITPLVTAIANDKESFNKEERTRSQNIESENLAQRKSVEAWNKQEDQRVSALKEAKSKSSSNFKAEQDKLKSAANEAKRKAFEEDKKNGIITKTFHIKIQNGYIYKNVKLLSNVIDFDESPTSRGIIEQMQKQTLISTMLFIIFSVLAALLIVIILQKIINDNKSEFGTLKALGIREKQISSKFIIIPIVASICSMIFTLILFHFAYNAIVGFLNSNYYLPVSQYFEINYVVLALSVVLPVFILIAYTKWSTSSLLGQKTLNLLNDIKDNHVKSMPKWLSNLATTAKLQYKTIVYNRDKSLIVFSCGVIITFLLSLITTMYFSSVETYGNVGKDLKYTTIAIHKKVQINKTDTDDEVLFNTFKITNILDNKYNEIDQKNYRKTISKTNTVDLNVLALPKYKAKGYDVSYLNHDEFNKGLILPNKYQLLYGIHKGDLLETTLNNEKVYLPVGGFQYSDENVFTFTSSALLSSVMNLMGKTNATLKNDLLAIVDKEDKFTIDKQAAIESINKIQNNIISLIVISSIIIISIITPLIFILVANIIDTNIKTIATLKAIGFRLGKIRSLTINPYIPIFVLGQIIALTLVGVYFGDQIINVFFGYFGYDVIFHLSWNSIIIILVSILVAYQSIIVLSSQRINIVKTARILNEDSGQVRISDKDINDYFKSTAKSVFDIDRPTFRFKWKDVPNLTWTEKRTVIWFVFKKYLPAYATHFVTILYSSWKAPLELFIQTQLAVVTQFTYGINQVINELDSLNIITTISQSVGLYKLQFFKNNSISKFRDAAKFEYIVQLAYIFFKLILFVLFADIIANFIDLNYSQRQFMNVIFLTSFITSVISLVNFRWGNFESMLDRKPQAIMSVISSILEYGTLLISLFFYKWIIGHYLLWIVAQSGISIAVEAIKFVVYWTIFRKYPNYEFINVSIFEMFLIEDWRVIGSILKDSMPSINASLASLPLNFISSLFIAKFTNSIISGDRNYIIYGAWVSQLKNIISQIAPLGFATLSNQILIRTLSTRQYLKSLKFAKFFRSLYAVISNYLPLTNIVAGIIPLLFIKLGNVALELTVISLIIGAFDTIINWRASAYTQILGAGGEFKFSSYTGIIFGSNLIQIINLILGAFGLLKFSSISSLIQNFIYKEVNRRRVNSGRWIRSTNINESLVNNEAEYEKLKMIEINKSGKYIYNIENREFLNLEDERITEKDL